MSRWSAGSGVLVAVAVGLSVAACSHGKPSAAPTASSSAASATSAASPSAGPGAGPSSSSGVSASSTSAASAATTGCPNPDGGSCRGELPAGAYHTVVFSPQISYVLPKGWGNFEDTTGN